MVNKIRHLVEVEELPTTNGILGNSASEMNEHEARSGA